MISPPPLKKGDKIAITAPARKITPQELEASITVFGSWDLTVVLPVNIYASDNQYAGTDQQRAADMQSLLDDPEIKAIICARGGYGLVRIIDLLDFTKFRENPKWIVGYSDITILHSFIQKNLEIETLHAIMPINFNSSSLEVKNSVEELRRALFGEKLSYDFPANNLNRNGFAKGILTGGNLSILYSQSGTNADPDTTGKVLFIEDLDEYLYHIDRMMMNLKRNGKLDNLAALLIGGMTGMHDNEVPFGKSAEEIISDAVKDYSYPVIFGVPSGHQDKNLPLVMGREVTVDSGISTSSITFNEPAPSNSYKRLKNLLKPVLYIVGGFLLLYLLYSLLLGQLTF